MKPDLKGLTKLAKAIEKAPRERFDIGTWLETRPSCGTVGCIAGWAAMVFPHRFQKTNAFHDPDLNITEYTVTHRASGETGPYAFARGFKISDYDAERLTSTNLTRKRTPKQAAQAIMSLVGRLRKQAK